MYMDTYIPYDHKTFTMQVKCASKARSNMYDTINNLNYMYRAHKVQNQKHEICFASILFE